MVQSVESAPAMTRGGTIISGPRTPILPLGLLCAAVAWSLYRWVLTSDFLDFGDEAMQLVAAKQVLTGDRLYLDIYSQWGPGTVMLAWLSELFGAKWFPGFRVVMLVLELLAAASLLWSSAWSRHHGAFAASAFLFLTAALGPIWLTHMLLYTAVGGYLAVISTALLVLPLLRDKRPPDWTWAAAGASWTFAIACAISFLPAAGFFAAVVAVLMTRPIPRLQELRVPAASTLIGCGAVLLGVVGWMAVYGDFGGYWAYHIRMNSEIFAKIMTPPINAVSALKFAWRAMIEGSNPDYTASRTGLLLGALGASALALTAPRVKALQIAAALALLFVLALFLNLRGGTLHHPGGTMIFCFALFACGIGACLERGIKAPFLALALAAPAALVSSTYQRSTSIYGIGVQSSEVRATTPNATQKDNPTSRLIRAVSEPNERIVAWEFIPSTYLFADRLPASIYNFLLPGVILWVNQEGSGRYAVDPCAELRENPPPVVVLAYWELQNVKDFAPCVPQFVQTNYVEVAKNGHVIYVRPDRVSRIRSHSTSE